ncbi:MAG: cupredoxin domain-containing protein [Candidatus Eisenbacteria bacterium]|uniref:Cupredoxin domain-containing protein n=1 Tax=Eiseniibacteriota bacterium TaxID=2212470 RepID=A0A538T1D2_UNCEI|nr:MAG: cupredoxin domain-containing protein [Candidatus Eisenbacteria bacterium]
MYKLMMAAALVAVLGAGCARESQEVASTGTRFAIAVTDAGFTPNTITVPAGRPVTLVVTRKTDQTCAKEIVFPEQNVRKALPLNEAVEISLPASPKREMTYVCGMKMLSGKIVVQ